MALASDSNAFESPLRRALFVTGIAGCHVWLELLVAFDWGD